MMTKATSGTEAMNSSDTFCLCSIKIFIYILGNGPQNACWNFCAHADDIFGLALNSVVLCN